MRKKYSLNAAKPKRSVQVRHAEIERAGLIHRVKGKPGQASFPLGVRRPGALKRFLEERG